MFCDPLHGLAYLPCGSNSACVNYTNPNISGCTCGTSGSAYPNLKVEGICTNGVTATPIANEGYLTCLSGYNITMHLNCKAQPGVNPNTAFCSTLVSSFGYQSGCYCQTCADYQYSSATCTPVCPSNLTCFYNSANNYHSCN
jgi:hypothetical protein